MHFWSIKGVYFLQNANNLNFKLFLFMLYTWPTKQVFCLYLRRIVDKESFWMSPKSTFWAFKKSCTSCPNYVIWTKSKRWATFHRAIKILDYTMVPCQSKSQFSRPSSIIFLFRYGFGDEDDGVWNYDRGQLDAIITYFRDNISLLSRVSQFTK